MVGSSRLRQGPNWAHVVSALGLLYVVLAVGRFAAVVASGDSLAEALLNVVQVGGPGAMLLYGGLRLPATELRPEAYPRVVTWCLGGAAVLLGIVGLLFLDPDVNVNHPLWSVVLAAAVGNLGGFAIGTNEARAISRARDAEDHERELQRQNERLESFASMLAHELRNPLNIAQIYLPQATAGDEAAAAEVESAHERIEEMIDVLLITARSTDSSVETGRASLGEVAAEAWEGLPVERANLVVETDRTVPADPVHLRHLLENLFKNAVEHGSTSSRPSADDAVEHGSTTSRPADDDAVEHADESVTVRVGDLPSGFYVADDGPGIPADERAAVFDAGYTTDADGIGLGLTFISQLAETYGWDCTLTESEAGGARFEFRNVETETEKRRADRA
ncbi:HAMP domain-containing histidine kinase [Halorussus gelatinilyticus]|uniref:histidine kinase n=1 Tax=Halorussus gelatinilyticus TaxID=2937524 RepID=A0A8U0IJF4_9EURY|nr:HAMP domain-containing sensor histidine kinase [Halorussus gelatinilyticus]UPW01153.1 HAMP domain-containing histidine kinase [Halorussus gelatinilyticus]